MATQQKTFNFLRDMEPSRNKVVFLHRVLKESAIAGGLGDNILTRQMIARQLFPLIGLDDSASELNCKAGADAIAGSFEDWPAGEDDAEVVADEEPERDAEPEA